MMDERPDRIAQIVYLSLMWCAWMNVSWDDLDPEHRRDLQLLSKRIVEQDLPALAAAVYGVETSERTAR